MLKKNNPLYMQIRDIIKKRIITGVYEKGSLLPTEVDFSKEFDVSLVTVRKAIELLQNQNYVKKQSGIGTQVIKDDAVSSLSTGRSFSDILNDKYENVTKSNISIEVKSEQNPFDSDRYTVIKRCYHVNNKPFIYIIHHVNTVIDDINFVSLYETLYERDVQLGLFNDQFYITPSTDETREVLKYDGPILCRRRNSYDLNNKLVEVSLSFYNTNVASYENEFLNK